MVAYRVPVLEQFAWQEPVIAIVSAPTLTAKGTRYLVSDSPSGDFSGNANQIAWADDDGWHFDVAAEGWKVYDKDTNAFYVFDGTVWSSASNMDGLTLTGDVSNTEAIDWDLLDNNAESLTFMTANEIQMLNFNTTDNAEVLSTQAVLKLENDIDLTSGSKEVTLFNATDAFQMTYDSTSIFNVDATNRQITASDMVVTGNLVVQGTTTTIETTELVVEDKLITLNKGGTAASAGDTGFEFEEDSAITGYLKTSADRNDFVFNAPANNFVLTLDVDANSTLNMLGNLTVESASFIDQDLTVDSTVVQFAGLSLTGDLNLSDANAGDVSIATNDPTALNVQSGLFVLDTTTGAPTVKTNGALDVTGVSTLRNDISLPNAIDVDLATDPSALSFDSANLAGILEIDSTVDAEKVNMAGALSVTGDIDASNLTLTGDINLDATSSLTDGTASATVAEMQTAYDTRAQYDDTLKVMRFVDPDTYAA